MTRKIQKLRPPNYRKVMRGEILRMVSRPKGSNPVLADRVLLEMLNALRTKSPVSLTFLQRLLRDLREHGLVVFEEAEPEQTGFKQLMFFEIQITARGRAVIERTDWDPLVELLN